MKKIIQNILKYLSKKVLIKYNPKIIGITGSVGKTSAKRAVNIVLQNKLKSRSGIKSFNNEIGLPLTVLGFSDFPGKSFSKWCKVFFYGARLIFKHDNKYPEILVLEMGSYRPGDIRYLTNIAKPDVAIITAIGPTHLENFKSIGHIKREKSVLIKSLCKSGVAILNYDDYKVRSMQKLANNRMFFGLDPRAGMLSGIWASDINFHIKKFGSLVRFKINYHGKIIPIKIKNLLASHQVYPVLSAFCIGLYFKISILDIVKSLEKYQVEPGRLKIIKGIKNSVLLDDTYNSAPASCEGALQALDRFIKSRKIAVLGDMLELGIENESGHKRIIKLANQIADKVILVGENMRKFAVQDENLKVFADSIKAGLYLQGILKKGDVVLIKGSQGVRMERVVKEVMQEPLQSNELLVRQEKEWLKK
ncbi:hypothetical protein CL633_03685 [bacterium]|nr:hypothetical protein [bacterium]